MKGLTKTLIFFILGFMLTGANFTSKSKAISSTNLGNNEGVSSQSLIVFKTECREKHHNNSCKDCLMNCCLTSLIYPSDEFVVQINPLSQGQLFSFRMGALNLYHDPPFRPPIFDFNFSQLKFN